MDELELLRELRRDLPANEAAARFTARRALRRAIVRSRRRRRTLRAALPLAAAALTAVALAGVPFRGERVESAAAALRSAARAATSAPDARTLAPGQYLYRRIRETGTSARAGCIWQAPVTVETWLAADGSARIRTTTGEHRPVGGAGCGRPPADLVPVMASKLLPAGGYRLPLAAGSALSYSEVQRLPHDPDALAAYLRGLPAPGCEPGDGCPSAMLMALLESPATSPALAAAAWGALARSSGASLVGTVRDAAGRSGTAIAIEQEGLRREVVFDEATGALLEQRLSAREVPAPAGASREQAARAFRLGLLARAPLVTTVVASGVVRSRAERVASLSG